MPIKGDRDYESRRRYDDKYNARRCAERKAAADAREKERVRTHVDANPLRPNDGKGEDWGYGRKWSGAEAEDRATRAAYPYIKLRSAYLRFVGEVPQCGPGDTKTAREMVQRVDAAIDHGGWTRAEWKRLYAMRAKWLRRAEGKDPRYNLVGNKPSMTKAERTGYDILQKLAKLREEMNEQGE